MRLTRLRVKNFRSIADIDIPLSPLTVLVGPNGSGKSNVVDALRFVRDVFARGLDQAVMDREGMGVIQRWGTEEEGITIGVTLRIEEVADYNYSGQITDDDFETEYDTKDYVIESEPIMQIDYDFTILENTKGTMHVQNQNLSIIVKQLDFPRLDIIRNGNSIVGKLGNNWVDNLTEQFLTPKGIIDTELIKEISPLTLFIFSRPLFGIEINNALGIFSPEFNKKPLQWWSQYDRIITKFERFVEVKNFYTLNPTDLRQPQQTLKEIPFDEKGRNLAAVLRSLSRNDNSSWESLKSALRQAVTGFDTLEVETVGGYLATKIIYQTGNTPSRISYLGQESDGTIRMLGLLAALLQDPSQQFISIEEPEANIHPGALAVLAGVIDEASLRSQILVTTHSPDMLDHLPVESFLVVEKVGDTTHVGPLDASQVASVRKRLFTPSELFRMEGLQRQTEPESAA